MDSSAIQKCLSSNGLGPGQTQGCSHPCVLMWQGSDSKQSWLSPWNRGSGSNSQLPSLSLLPSLAPSGLWSSLADLQLLVCFGVSGTAGISLRRQSLPSVKLHRVFTSCCHCLSLISMGYFMVLVGWDGLKAEQLIPTSSRATAAQGSCLPGQGRRKQHSLSPRHGSQPQKLMVSGLQRPCHDQPLVS